MRVQFVLPAILTLCACQNGPGPSAFDLRSKCGALANTFEDRYRREHKEFYGTVTNHVTDSQRCFVDVIGIQDVTRLRTVYDAQERKALMSCWYTQENGVWCVDENGKPIDSQTATDKMDQFMGTKDGWPGRTK
jgi:hypothetical protein